MVEAAWFSTNHSFKKIYILYPIFETCWCREEKPFIPPTPHLPHLAKYSTNPSIGSLTEKGGEGGTGLFTSFGFNLKNKLLCNLCAVFGGKNAIFFCNLCNFITLYIEALMLRNTLFGVFSVPQKLLLHNFVDKH